MTRWLIGALLALAACSSDAASAPDVAVEIDAAIETETIADVAAETETETIADVAAETGTETIADLVAETEPETIADVAVETEVANDTSAPVAAAALESTRVFGGPGWDTAYALATDADGRVYLGGSYQQTFSAGGETFDALGNVSNISDGFLASYDRDLAHRWSFSFGTGDGDDALTHLVVLSDGDLAIVGNYWGGPLDLGQGPMPAFSDSYDHTFVARYSPDGELRWAQRIGFRLFIDDLVTDAADNLYLAGDTSGGHDFPDPVPCCSNLGEMFVVSFDGSGKYRWTRGARSLDYGSSHAASVAIAGDTAYLAGRFDGTIVFSATEPFSEHSRVTAAHSSQDAFIAAYDAADGDLRWARTIPGRSRDSARHVVEADADGVWVLIDNAYAVDLAPGLEIPYGLTLVRWDRDGAPERIAVPPQLPFDDFARAADGTFWIQGLGPYGADFEPPIAIEGSGDPFVARVDLFGGRALWGAQVKSPGDNWLGGRLTLAPDGKRVYFAAHFVDEVTVEGVTHPGPGSWDFVLTLWDVP